ncbi:hypothetical protein ASPBRDRAFT_616049 [Aspergillus brasiliensis CBS 101740]|uniref:Uncharacterized protein n=1 Tax=Aspergillus brasiliensis (strain CBS 101740 / IMI 381727 / IBT 21946) TaxID=767769 RepID=A0A1L9UF57_ASPBC|nr:hypothetical protein ASPBRDRAFT_616049 [Aspergillus brasiliensis CBS 101740]
MLITRQRLMGARWKSVGFDRHPRKIPTALAVISIGWVSITLLYVWVPVSVVIVVGPSVTMRIRAPPIRSSWYGITRAAIPCLQRCWTARSGVPSAVWPLCQGHGWSSLSKVSWRIKSIRARRTLPIHSKRMLLS